MVLQTWDFAGQEMYYSMAHIFITAPGSRGLGHVIGMFSMCSKVRKVYSDLLSTQQIRFCRITNCFCSIFFICIVDFSAGML